MITNNQIKIMYQIIINHNINNNNNNNNKYNIKIKNILYKKINLINNHHKKIKITSILIEISFQYFC
jgi:hypothetical protein